MPGLEVHGAVSSVDARVVFPDESFAVGIDENLPRRPPLGIYQHICGGRCRDLVIVRYGAVVAHVVVGAA